jgi:hypothetical protein
MQEEKATLPEEAALQAPDARLTEVTRALARAPRLAKARRAYQSGMNARFARFFRVPPFYEEPEMDEFFFAGYDGEPWKQIVARVIGE